MPRSVGIWFCRFKGSCACKQIRKPKNVRSKGVYYVVCRSEEGCTMKTIEPQKIHLPPQFVSPLKDWDYRVKKLREVKENGGKLNRA